MNTSYVSEYHQVILNDDLEVHAINNNQKRNPNEKSETHNLKNDFMKSGKILEKVVKRWHHFWETTTPMWRLKTPYEVLGFSSAIMDERYV